MDEVMKPADAGNVELTDDPLGFPASGGCFDSECNDYKFRKKSYINKGDRRICG